MTAENTSVVDHDDAPTVPGDATISDGPTAALANVVAAAHRLSLFGYRLHPYHVLFDFGVVGMLATAAAFAALVEPLSLPAFYAVFVLTFLTYEFGYLPLKERLVDTEARSYLQDLLLFVLPVTLASSAVVGLDVRAVADLVGLQLAVLVGCIRVGCFLGGCCYGVRTRFGVRYPETVFEPEHDGCRSFTPGEEPDGRVFPIQLVEALVNACLFVGLWARLLGGAPLDGSTLPLYLGVYAAYRFVGDFARVSSARPRRGPFSEAQVVSVVVMVGAGWLLI